MTADEERVGVGLPAAELRRGKTVLRLEVVERNGDDFIVEGRVSVRRFSAVAACDASLADLGAWRTQLAEMYETLGGRAHLEQRAFAVEMEADGRGRVTLNGMFDSDTGWGVESGPSFASRCPHSTRQTCRL